jgi:hypothetical protein
MHFNPNSHQYDDAMIFHKHYALSLLRSELGSVTEPSSPMNDVIYGAAVLLAIQAIATFNSNPTSSIDLDWMPLISGFKAFLTPMWDSISDSIFYPFIGYNWPSSKGHAEQQEILKKFNLIHLSSSLPPSYTEHVIRLSSLLDPFFPDKSYSAPPLSSILSTPIPIADQVECTDDTTSDAPNGEWIDPLRHLLAWSATLPSSFISRAREEDPAILTILGWMFCLVRKIYVYQPLWWIERISKQGVETMARFTLETQ